MIVDDSSRHDHVSNSKAEGISKAAVEAVNVAQSWMDACSSVAKDTIPRTQIASTSSGCLRHVQRYIKNMLPFLP